MGGETVYKFLSTGELEIPVRNGYRIIPGCSCKGLFEFGDRMAELQEWIGNLAEDDPRTLEQVYQEDRRFRFLADRILELNGIDPDWVRPRDLGWLLFGHQGEAGPVESPLLSLNGTGKPRWPRKPQQGAEGHHDFIALLAAIASQCDSIEEAYAVATSKPARDVLGTLEDIAWNRQTEEEKGELRFQQWAVQRRREDAGERAEGWAS